MILTDKLEVLSGDGSEVLETLRAQVGHTTAGRSWERPPGERDALEIITEELRAIIPPSAYATDKQRFAWRGETYTQNGPPKVRRRNGKDHHYTITLEASQ